MNTKTKALKVIEGYCLLGERRFNLDKGLQREVDLAFLYQMAHVGLGHCQNPHEDWKAELEETYQKMVDGQIIDKE